MGSPVDRLPPLAAKPAGMHRKVFTGVATFST
jgi:hypothetical protein